MKDNGKKEKGLDMAFFIMQMEAHIAENGLTILKKDMECLQELMEV